MEISDNKDVIYVEDFRFVQIITFEITLQPLFIGLFFGHPYRFAME